MPVIRVGVQAPQGSLGQVVDLDGPRASVSSIANVSGESIAYSLDGGANWVTLAAGVSGGSGVIDAGMLRLRKVASGGAYPAPVDVTAELYGLSEEGFSAPQVAALQSMVSGAGRNLALTSLRSEALWKVGTSNASFGLSSGLSAVAATVSTKVAMDAPFVAARLVAYNRGNQAVTGIKALIGVSETMAQTNSASLSHVTIGGTAYAALAGATDANGFRAVTWAGAATVDHAASSTAPDIKLSDWAPLNAVPRADGGSGYPIMWRTYRAGSGAGSWAFTPLTATPAPTAANRNREIVNCIAYNDAVAAIGNSMALNNTYADVAIEVRFDRPVVSVWGVGDSTMSCHGLVVDKVSSWLWRACADLSTEARPVVFASFGATGRDSADFITNAEAFLAAGVAPPTIMVVSLSINDVTADPNVRTLETARNALLRAIELCREYRVPYLAFSQCMPYEGMTLAEDNLRKQINAEAQALAVRHQVGWLDFSAVSNGASPELFVPAYKQDAFHPNEAGIDAVLAPEAREWVAQALPG